MDLTAGFFYYIILKCTTIEKYAFFDLQTGFLHQTYMHISINPKKNQVLFYSFHGAGSRRQKGRRFFQRRILNGVIVW